MLSFFLFFLPFQFALSPTEGIDLPVARVLSVGIFIGWFLFGVWKQKIRIAWGIQTAFFLSFWFFLGLSVFFSEEVSWAWRKLFFLLSFLPLYFVFLDIVSTGKERVIVLIRAFVVGAFISGFIGCIQVLLQFFMPVETLFVWWTKGFLPFFLGDTFSTVVAEYPSLLANISGVTVMRASAFFPDPHMHAFFLGLALPFAVYLAQSENKRVWMWIAGIILLADLLTFSRGAYLGFVFAFFGLTFRALSLRYTHLRKLVLGACVVFILVFLPTPVTERFWSSFSREDGSISARLSLYQEAVINIQEHPWIGVGLGNYPLIVKPSADRRDPIYVHNLWLDLTVEIGILGTLFFLLFYLRTIGSSYLQSRNEAKSLSLAIFCSILIFFGHSMVETPIFSVQVFPAILFVLALGNIPYDRK